MRAQVSLELFLALSLFVLLLYWFSSQAGFATDAASEMALKEETSSVSKQVARLVGLACARGQELEFDLPVLTDGFKEVDYFVNFSSNAVLAYTDNHYPPAYAVTYAACGVEDALINGAGTVCINASNASALVAVTGGSC